MNIEGVAGTLSAAFGYIEWVEGTLSAAFGFMGSAVGILAAVLWFYASRIRWTMEREREMHPGEYGPRRGKWCALTYYVAQEPYLEAVGKWNRRAAIATAVSMFFWAFQTFAGLAR